MPAKKKVNNATDSADGKSKNFITGIDQLSSFIKNHKNEHYNSYEEIDYRVSTGSLNLDIEIGGLGPGVHRFAGGTESGKTSEFFEVMRNFLLMENPKCPKKGLYIMSEGRLSKEVRERSGVKFVTDPSEWVDGTCFVFKSNIYETIFEMLKQIITVNQEKCLYMIGIDSLDTMIRKNDMDRSFGDSQLVAGGPVILSHFFKHMALPIGVFGHMVIFMSQKRADIPASQYSPSRRESYSGGNAARHQSNFTLEFLEKNIASLILENDSLKPDRLKNKIIGHRARVKIEKSTNEKSMITVDYPIRYGRKNGNSIWKEREVVDMMGYHSQYEKSGSWFAIYDGLLKELSDAGLEMPEKFQGENNIVKFLEENQKVTEFLYRKFVEILTV